MFPVLVTMISNVAFSFILTTGVKVIFSTSNLGSLTNVVLLAHTLEVSLDLATTIFVKLPYSSAVNVILKLADLPASKVSLSLYTPFS